MKKILQILATLFIGVSIPAQAQQDATEILKAVVKIQAVIPDYARSAGTLGTEREGSGVVLDSRGHILTIGYLIMESEKIEVTGSAGKIGATSVAYDPITGFGLLKTETPLSVRPMELGESSEVKEGDPLIVAGHGGAEAVQGVRVVSRKEFAGSWEYLLDSPILTTPPYSNWGGAALIDRAGRLVGIGSLFTTFALPGLGPVPGNMFVPIDLLKPILADLMTKGRSPEKARPWLGLNTEETHGRLIVTRVTPEGPAAKAGLKTGDIILGVDGKELNGLADFYRKVWALGNPGIEVPLTVLQGSRIVSLTVKSGDRYEFYPLKPKKKI